MIQEQLINGSLGILAEVILEIFPMATEIVVRETENDNG